MMNQLNEIYIRQAEADDFYSIVKLIQKLASLEKKKVLITAETLIKDGGFKSNDDIKLFECAVVETKIGTKLELIGYSTWYYAFTSWDGRIAYLEDLDFEPSFKKKEIMEKLLSFVAKETIRNDAVWLRFSGK